MKAKTLTDPIGPGSPAWEECDRAVELWHEGKHHAAGCAMARMVTHLRLHGHEDYIPGWKKYIYEQRA